MALTADQITLEALNLPITSRAELAEKLVGSLDLTLDDDLRQSWAAEVIDRRDDVRMGRVQTIPGDQALADIRQILAR